MRRPRLKWVILAIFLALTLPVLVTIITMNYVVTERRARDESLTRIAQHQADVVHSVDTLFREVSTLVQAMAAAGQQQPDLFLDDGAIDVLAAAVRGTPDVVSAYVGLQRDGRFLQARRMFAGQEVHGNPLPAGTQFARRTVIPTAQGEGLETYAFETLDGEPLGVSQGLNPYDPRARHWYQITQQADALTVSDPDLFAALSLVGFTIAAPIHWNGDLAGIVAIDLTLDGLSHYLAERLVSPGSISFILDAQGNVIANSAERVSFHDDNGRLRLPHVSDWADPLAGIAYSQRARAAVDGQTFFLTHDGAEYAASLQPIAATRDKAWQVLVIAPMDDFNAAIRFSNQRLLLAGLGMTLAQIVVIWFLARRMATPLERLVTHVERIRELNRDPMTDLPRSRIREIAALSKAVETLDAAIRTFASFVPVSLVRDLLQTEQQISIGGSSRFLTVFFSDIEGFSELSETIPAQELVERISDYLSIATAEVNREGGTIDKFIGDGVMAFWGAPNVIDDHALCACVAAMRVSHAIDRLNDDLEHRGRKPLNIRIGIHSDAVVVGNIGSSERLNYTVLGDGVNIAARLEALNKAYGTRICISHAVYREAGSALWVRPMGEVQVKGRRAQIIVYELMGIVGHGPDLEPSADRQLLARLTWEAFDLRCAGDAAGARALYARILESFPDDPVARGNLADLSETASA